MVESPVHLGLTRTVSIPSAQNVSEMSYLLMMYNADACALAFLASRKIAVLIIGATSGCPDVWGGGGAATV